MERISIGIGRTCHHPNGKQGTISSGVPGFQHFAAISVVDKISTKSISKSKKIHKHDNIRAHIDYSTSFQQRPLSNFPFIAVSNLASPDPSEMSRTPHPHIPPSPAKLFEFPAHGASDAIQSRPASKKSGKCDATKFSSLSSISIKRLRRNVVCGKDAKAGQLVPCRKGLVCILSRKFPLRL